MDGPTLVYDDDCGFCTWWARWLDDRSDVRLVGFSELTDELRDRLPADYEDCSHLLADGRRYSCGASIEEAFLRTGVGSHCRPVVDALRRLDAYRWVRERVYRAVADNRSFLGRIVSEPPPARATE